MLERYDLDPKDRASRHVRLIGSLPSHALDQLRHDEQAEAGAGFPLGAAFSAPVESSEKKFPFLFRNAGAFIPHLAAPAPLPGRDLFIGKIAVGFLRGTGYRESMREGFSLDGKAMQLVYALWDELGAFPAGETEAALRHLFGWLEKQIGADNVIWIGAVRLLRGAAAKEDAFNGWRLRARQPMREGEPEYRKLIASYYDVEHYRKGSGSRIQARSQVRALFHSGMTGRTMFAQAGRFRVYRLRDGWIDYGAFEKTEHYDVYYRRQGIVDRMHAGFPLNADAESIFMIDRYGAGRRSRKAFTDREKALVEMALRGVRELHRRLFLERGLLMGEIPLTLLQQQVLRGLLTKVTEKDLARQIGQQPRTLHKYVTSLYARFGVQSRAGLMAMWLGH